MPELPPPPEVPTPGAGAPGWVLDLLRSLVVGEAGGDRPSARRMAGLLGGGLAVVVVGVVAWRALVLGGGGGAGPPPELTMPRASGPSPVSAEGSSASPSTSAGATVIVTHVAGAVARPGVYRLGGAPRIADAVDAAGGPAPDAELDAVNLAAPVGDGERVYVPRKGEAPPPSPGAGSGSGTTGVAGPLDLNTATAEQLEALPGIGPSTASAILAYRQEHGRFRSVDELLEVRGIGEAKLAELRPRVRVR